MIGFYIIRRVAWALGCIFNIIIFVGFPIVVHSCDGTHDRFSVVIGIVVDGTDEPISKCKRLVEILMESHGGELLDYQQRNM